MQIAFPPPRDEEANAENLTAKRGDLCSLYRGRFALRIRNGFSEGYACESPVRSRHVTDGNLPRVIGCFREKYWEKFVSVRSPA